MKIYYLLRAIALFASCTGNAQKDYACVVTPTGTWTLVWNDEFDYTGFPDSIRWSYDTRGNAWDWGNNEAEKKNAFVTDGVLKIIVLKERNGDKEYSLVRLLTQGKGD